MCRRVFEMQRLLQDVERMRARQNVKCKTYLQVEEEVLF
jgi:hypothetical protein